MIFISKSNVSGITLKYLRNQILILLKSSRHFLWTPLEVGNILYFNLHPWRVIRSRITFQPCKPQKVGYRDDFEITGVNFKRVRCYQKVSK